MKNIKYKLKYYNLNTINLLLKFIPINEPI